jgi:hypothetical protein
MAALIYQQLLNCLPIPTRTSDACRIKYLPVAWNFVAPFFISAPLILSTCKTAARFFSGKHCREATGQQNCAGALGISSRIDRNEISHFRVILKSGRTP